MTTYSLLFFFFFFVFICRTNDRISRSCDPIRCQNNNSNNKKRMNIYGPCMWYGRRRNLGGFFAKKKKTINYSPGPKLLTSEAYYPENPKP